MAATTILATYLAVLGVPTRYVLAAVALVVIVVVAVALLARRRRPRLVLRDLDEASTQRYLHEFEAIERDFVDRPEQAAARARGLAEEVMRRRGFPDRIEPAQRIRDISGHDREAARALEAANASLAANGDAAQLLHAVQSYRLVVQRLTSMASR